MRKIVFVVRGNCGLRIAEAKSVIDFASAIRNVASANQFGLSRQRLIASFDLFAFLGRFEQARPLCPMQAHSPQESKRA